MANIEVKEYKIKMDEKEYTFRLDFKALIKFNNKFENSMEIFNNFLQGKNIYDCITKILSCSCKEKEFTEDELAESLSFDFKTMKLFDEITFTLIEGVMGETGKKKTKGNKETKNE